MTDQVWCMTGLGRPIKDILKMDQADHKTHDLNLQDRLSLDPAMISFLHDIRKWTAVISIIGFVFLAILFVVGLWFLFNPNTAGVYMALMPEFVGIIYLLFVLIGFFPIFYLFRFSVRLKSAIDDHDNQSLLMAFKNLKAHYKYIGILLLIIAVIYGIVLLFSLIAGVSVFMGR
jgi:hypothetical protein